MAHPHQRGDAAANARFPGRAGVARMGSAVAGSVCDGENLCGRGFTRMGKARLSPTRHASARVRDGTGPRLRRPGARRRRDPLDAPRRRRIYGSRHRLFRIRTASSCGGHQCSPRHRKGGARRRRLGALGTRPTRRRGTVTNRERCPVFGGAHGVGRPGMHGPRPAMPDVSAELLRMA
ncbi:Uncharacterised protein [Mycobacteroides abscessus subsp. abscessus]|nr:Uncharacterised protein [Mycobacteroides abscessus subsp. abscessus]